MTRCPPRPSKRAREAAFAAQAPHDRGPDSARLRLAWDARTLRVLDDRGREVERFAIEPDGRVRRVLPGLPSVPVLDGRYRPLTSGLIRGEADARRLLARIRQTDGR